MAVRACGPTTIPDYYGAFVLDPDGNNVEAVCHRSRIAGQSADEWRGR